MKSVCAVHNLNLFRAYAACMGATTGGSEVQALGQACKHTFCEVRQSNLTGFTAVAGLPLLRFSSVPIEVVSLDASLSTTPSQPEAHRCVQVF